MKLDITFHDGRPGSPVAVCIHGLGMDRTFWLSPLETRIFAKNVPLRIMAARPPRALPADKGRKISLGESPQELNSLWAELTEAGFSAVCWSQRRPVGPVIEAVEELALIMDEVRERFPRRPIVLIGHSRGGLIARKYMEARRDHIRALVTIGTPHRGSSLSRLGQYLAPLAAVLRKMLPADTQGTVSTIVQNLSALLEGDALRELLPDSPFFRDLRDRPAEGIRYLSFGGNETRLVTIYVWQKREGTLSPRPLLHIPDSLFRYLPDAVLPDEVCPGKGDFMVTTESAVMPWASEHETIQANHISLSWHENVIGKIAELLRALS